MTSRMRAGISRVCLGATLLGVGAASAGNPPGVSFSIATPKTEFYFGEAIPLELTFTAAKPQTFLADTRLQDRVGRMNYIEEFVAEPASLTEDPLQGLPGESGGMGGLSGGPVVLSEKPFIVKCVLNEWVRFKKPGLYRIYVISRRVSEAPEPVTADSYLQLLRLGKPLELTSNTVTLRIRPAAAAWINDQIAAARKILDIPVSPNGSNRDERIRAMQVLRFLDSPVAAKELLMRLTAGEDVDSYAAYMGVLGSPFRRQLLPLMEQRLVAPEQPVWDAYLDTLTRLAELLEPGASMPRAEFRERKRDEYATRLIASLPTKTPEARAVSLNTLLNLGLRNSAQPEPWVRGIAASLIADFRSLPAMSQSMLLQYRWELLKGMPGTLPLLRSLIEKPPSAWGDPPIRDMAVRRLYELSPAEGRRIILDEIRHPTMNLRFSTLAILPDPSLPDLNDAMADQNDPLLVLRYATGAVVKRVEQAYLARRAEIEKQQLPTCTGPLAFYFLKFDPPFGEQQLRRDFAQPASYPACYDIGFQFQQLGRWAYSPALERFAIESLSSGIVLVKHGAAEVLGNYGSPAAQKPLWDAMEYFRSWWKGREKELMGKNGQEGIQFERALRIALGQADGWVLQQPQLERLLALCSSEWCRDEVQRWIQSAKAPVSIVISPRSDGFRYDVAQYGSGDFSRLERKVRQYPEATIFHVERWPNEPNVEGLKQAREQIEAMVRAVGRKLAP